MKKLLALTLLLAALTALPVGHASEAVPALQEDLDHRRAAIAFADENRALLDELVEYIEALDPSPRLVMMEKGLFTPQHLVADLGGPEYVPFDDAYLDGVLRDTLLESVALDGDGWAFGLDFTSGWLDVGHYYDLLRPVSDPLAGTGRPAATASSARDGASRKTSSPSATGCITITHLTIDPAVGSRQ